MATEDQNAQQRQQQQQREQQQKEQKAGGVKVKTTQQQTEGVPLTDIDPAIPQHEGDEPTYDGTNVMETPPPTLDPAGAAALQAARDKEKAEGDIRTEEMAQEQESSVPPDSDQSEARSTRKQSS